jgi:hypothetical protein
LLAIKNERVQAIEKMFIFAFCNFYEKEHE